jgi:hypothetical protein
VAGHVDIGFNVTAPSVFAGGLNASDPGVTVYVSTLQDAQTLTMGHPSTWVYSSGLTNSTDFSVPLGTGSYVIWLEGADMGCGQSVVTPLELLTDVTVDQAFTLMPD